MSVTIRFKRYRLRIVQPRRARFVTFEEPHRQLNFSAPNFNALA